MTNKKWCRIIDGGKRIEYAQGFVELDGRIWINPTAEQYERAGWIRNARNAPEARDGYVARVEGYEAHDGQIYAVYAYDAVTPPPRVFSKLYLILALKKRGLYEQFKAMLASTGLEDLWIAANELNDGYEGFDAFVAQAKTALNLTDAEVEEILGEAVAR